MWGRIGLEQEEEATKGCSGLRQPPRWRSLEVSTAGRKSQLKKPKCLIVTVPAGGRPHPKCKRTLGCREWARRGRSGEQLAEHSTPFGNDLSRIPKKRSPGRGQALGGSSPGCPMEMNRGQNGNCVQAPNLSVA